MPSPQPKHGWSLTRAGVAVVTEADGTIGGQNAGGIYHRDRRLVAGLRLLVDGSPPEQLSGSRIGPAEDRLTYGYWTDAPDPQAIIVRERSLDGGYTERIEVRCFRNPITIALEVQLDPSGATVYHLPDDDPTVEDRRRLAAAMWAENAALDDLRITQKLHIEPGEAAAFSWGIRLPVDDPDRRPTATVRTSARRLQRSLDNAVWDLEALMVTEPATGRPFLAVGAPHFLAVFGRDSLIASQLAMIADPLGAMRTLEVLAHHQGTAHDKRTLEAPGRILHELRIGEMGVFGLEAGTPYYGSIDATPLFVVSLAECLRWGCPPQRVGRLLPAARSAVGWCRSHRDDRGFIHSVPHDRGITNQNWKDSGDSVVRPDGAVVCEATSPVEVQGYYHQALLALAELEATVGDRDAVESLRAEADELQARFHRHFVLAEAPHVAYVLDAAGEPIKVAASNVGHLLCSSMIDDDLAALLADRLLGAAEFSGWGLRTLSADEAAYNPLAYHLGTVWPHDTAMLLRGLSHRRFDRHTRRVADGLVDLAAAVNYQLPELLGGFDREQFPEPVPYPASARPQAWAAAVPFQIVTSLLGFQPAMHRGEIRLRPILNEGRRITVENLRLGERVIHIDATGTHAKVTGDIGDIKVITD